MGNTAARQSYSYPGTHRAPRPRSTAVTVDGGALEPLNGLLRVNHVASLASASSSWPPSPATTIDWRRVRKLILERRLAPFYCGQEEPAKSERESENCSAAAAVPVAEAPNSSSMPLPTALPPPGRILLASLPTGSTSATSSEMASAVLTTSVETPSTMRRLLQALQAASPRRWSVSVAAVPSSHVPSSHVPRTSDATAMGATVASSGSTPSHAVPIDVSSANDASTSPPTSIPPYSASLPRGGDPVASCGFQDDYTMTAAIECPICFLFFPRNINYTRCCEQPLCTECFVQIRRPATTGDPACCPYCVQSEFGVIYDARNAIMSMRRGITDEKNYATDAGDTVNTVVMLRSSSDATEVRSMAHRAMHQRLGVRAPGVVSSDEIHAGYVAELARRRELDHALALRQPQIVPSARMQRQLLRTYLDPRSQIDADVFTAMRDFAQELEEMMVAEAMRLSLAEQGSTVDAAAPVDVVGQVSAPVYISETNDDDDDDDVPLSALVGNMRMVTEEQVEIENGTEAVAATSPTDTAPDPSPQLGASQSHDSNGDTRNAPLT